MKKTLGLLFLFLLASALLSCGSAGSSSGSDEDVSESDDYTEEAMEAPVDAVSNGDGSYTFTVKDRVTGSVISGASVTVDGGETATSDVSGQFTISSNEYFTVQADGYDRGTRISGSNTIYKWPIPDDLIAEWSCYEMIPGAMEDPVSDYDDHFTFNEDGTYSRSGESGYNFESRDFRVTDDDPVNEDQWSVGYLVPNRNDLHHGDLSHRYDIPEHTKWLPHTVYLPLDYFNFKYDEGPLVRYGSKIVAKYGTADETDMVGTWACSQSQEDPLNSGNTLTLNSAFQLNADYTGIFPGGQDMTWSVSGNVLTMTVSGISGTGTFRVITSDIVEVKSADLHGDDGWGMLWWRYERQ